ncbi:MAG: bifunctional 3,4-dihydroxy-2-butanone-4-phosphate synthase/GTP cyclohydrolase II [Candidatus Dormibacteraeota bacterium]|nr:bifunctional 3,4-dihydroxy-2-butanone-4-phosphate synthase/GTP cyclohydrolase II [Candidatus Dormibacteraeota bacterium]MBV9525087.1 bifunctional 3,4-dihydroxy-2-butanone-4-phosphate synthase/GTP cyclohydrolase II [Candidatus Dormibacteraeota bacterium]
MGRHRELALLATTVPPFATVDEAVEALAAGRPVIVVDDADRENEGDLLVAADRMTPELMGFLVRHTSGVICVAMPGSRLDALRLPLMTVDNTEKHQTAFTISVDARGCTTTGISAADRAATVAALADPHTRPEDLLRPGHIFPLRYCEGGVLRRAGHTEAAVDLCRIAERQPVGVISEIVDDAGNPMQLPELTAFAAQHGLLMIAIAELVRYRLRRERLIRRVSTAQIPTPYGAFVAHAYESAIDGIAHVALVKGDISSGDDVLVRVHSECLTGDVFGSARCDCGPQLDLALQRIADEGRGVVVYLRGQEGRGIGLAHKLRAYELQERGRDTVDANLELGLPVDTRHYGIGAQILTDLGVRRLRLMTNNPAKYTGLAGYDLTLVSRVPLQVAPSKHNVRYLRTKRDRMGHLLVMDEGKTA